MIRLIKAFKYSIAGVISCFHNEPAFRLESYLLLLAIPLAIFLADNPTDFILLIGSYLLIMIVELLNSAIENVNDRIGMEFHELCKRAKDQSSAAVLLTIILASIVWTVYVFDVINSMYLQ